MTLKQNAKVCDSQGRITNAKKNEARSAWRQLLPNSRKHAQNTDAYSLPFLTQTHVISKTKRRLKLPKAGAAGVIQTVITRFREAVSYLIWKLENKSTKYDRTVIKSISKLSRWMTAQIKLHIFDPFESISIMWFLCNF